MGKTAVIYKSKYGATKKYAQWIADELKCDLLERENVRADMLESYDTIVYGGGIYANGISGIDLLTKNYDRIKDKNIVVFTCGLADPQNSKNISRIREGLKKAFTEELYRKAAVYHLRGGIDYSKLGFMHKTMMSMLYKMASKKEPSQLNDEDSEMLCGYGKAVDFTNKASIEPLVSYVKGLSVKP